MYREERRANWQKKTTIRWITGGSEPLLVKLLYANRFTEDKLRKYIKNKNQSRNIITYLIYI